MEKSWPNSAASRVWTHTGIRALLCALLLAFGLEPATAVTPSSKSKTSTTKSSKSTQSMNGKPASCKKPASSPSSSLVIPIFTTPIGPVRASKTTSLIVSTKPISRMT
jgi:hypothetical protein